MKNGEILPFIPIISCRFNLSNAEGFVKQKTGLLLKIFLN